MPDHFQDQWAPLVAPDRRRGGDHHAAGRHAGLRQRLPTSGGARQGARHTRSAPQRAGSRSGSGRAGNDRTTTRRASATTVRGSASPAWARRCRSCGRCGPPISRSSSTASTTGARCGRDAPTARPGGPSITIGGGGSRMLSLAGPRGRHRELERDARAPVALGADDDRVGDAAAFDEKIAWVRDAAGPRLETLELQCHCPFVRVTSDTSTVAEQMGKVFGLSPVEALEAPLTLLGTVDELCEMVESQRGAVRVQLLDRSRRRDGGVRARRRPPRRPMTRAGTIKRTRPRARQLIDHARDVEIDGPSATMSQSNQCVWTFSARARANGEPRPKVSLPEQPGMRSRSQLRVGLCRRARPASGYWSDRAGQRDGARSVGVLRQRSCRQVCQ